MHLGEGPGFCSTPARTSSVAIKALGRCCRANRVRPLLWLARARARRDLRPRAAAKHGAAAHPSATLPVATAVRQTAAIVATSMTTTVPVPCVAGEGALGPQGRNILSDAKKNTKENGTSLPGLAATDRRICAGDWGGQEGERSE